MINIDSISTSMLFKEIDKEDIPQMLSCLGGKVIQLKKGEYALRVGEVVKYVGVVQSGVLQIIKEDIDGERSILSQLKSGDYYAEVLCCARILESPVSVMAETDSSVVLLDFNKILQTCHNTCIFHSKLIENMLHIVSLKNIGLQQRMDYLSKKTLRKRIMKYLINESEGKSDTFEIPFNREELADYLCIDRSALSRELMHLKNENIIDYWKNHFKVY